MQICIKTEEDSMSRSRSPRRGGMQIFIKTEEDKTITLDVDAFDRIAVVKALIQAKKEGIPTHLQGVGEPILAIEGRCGNPPGMEDGRTLSDYQVKDGMRLVMGSVFVILVRTLPGTTIRINVSPLFDSIFEVKARIQDETSIPIHQQRLIFKDEVLTDSSCCLSKHKIWGGAQLTLVRVVPPCHFRGWGGDEQPFWPMPPRSEHWL